MKLSAVVMLLCLMLGACAQKQKIPMPLSQLFEVLFDSSVVVKYPIF